MPAIGWPPTKWTPAGSSACAQRSTSAFVLAVSVTIVPRCSADAISSKTPRTLTTGVATTTRPAFSTASVRLRATCWTAPARRARSATSGSRSKPTTTVSAGAARFSARPSEPPINPSPMIASVATIQSLLAPDGS